MKARTAELTYNVYKEIEENNVGMVVGNGPSRAEIILYLMERPETRWALSFVLYGWHWTDTSSPQAIDHIGHEVTTPLECQITEARPTQRDPYNPFHPNPDERFWDLLGVCIFPDGKSRRFQIEGYDGGSSPYHRVTNRMVFEKGEQ